MRTVVLVMVAAIGGVGLTGVRANDPPPKLTVKEREKAEAELMELFQTGVKHTQQANWVEAGNAFEQAARLARVLYPAGGDPAGRQALASLTGNVGFVLQKQGKVAAAESRFREALALCREIYSEPHKELAASLNNLGMILLESGRYTEAEQLLGEALGVKRKISKGDPRELALALNNLAGVIAAQARYADALPLFQDALEARRRLHKRPHPDVAESLNNVGLCLSALGEHTVAEKADSEALDMWRALYPIERFPNGHPSLARGLNNLGRTLDLQGKGHEAERLFRESLAMDRRLYPDNQYPVGHPAIARTLGNLAALLAGRGQYPEAGRLYRESLQMTYALVREYAALRSEGEALTLTAAMPARRDGFLTFARRSGAEPAAVYAEVWASKAVVARVAEVRAVAARAAADPRAASLLVEQRETRRRRAELLLTPKSADPKTREARDAMLDGLSRRVTDLNTALRPLLPAVDRLDKLETATSDDLHKALPADAAFVDLLAFTLLGQDPKVPGIKGGERTRSYAAFVITRGGVQWIDLGPADPIEKAVSLWREAITTPPFTVAADLPAAVRKRVWNPIRNAFPSGIKVVYVSPDAALARIPWAALPGDKPGTVLIDDYAVAVVPHGRFLLDALWPADPTRNRTAGLLAVGGVQYGAEPEGSGVWGSALALARSRSRGELPADPSKKLVWDDLPGAKAEAEQVRARAVGRGYDARLVAGPTASADHVLAELSRVRFAHIATHGFFADKQFRSVMQVDPKLFETVRGGQERIGAGALNPLVMSGLVFAGANRPGTPGRGLLTGEALLDRDLSGLELAVLSACETGLGDVAGGEGVFGLQRAFHVAGCRNVVASLWKVNDDATAALMAEFYRRLWDEKTPVPPVEALRQAQLAVMRADPKDFRAIALRGIGKGDVKATDDPVATPPMVGGKANPPAYWAAFTLSGPGR